MKTFLVNVRLKAIVSFQVVAESLEAALVRAREEATKKCFFAKDVEYIDGNEEIIGVDADWDLE